MKAGTGSINWMCKQLEISRAAYYKWLHRKTSEQELKNIKLAELIKEYDERFNHILGYRRMTSWINHFNHTNYSQKRVHLIMEKADKSGNGTIHVQSWSLYRQRTNRRFLGNHKS